jgi:hypothetical protein
LAKSEVLDSGHAIVVIMRINSLPVVRRYNRATIILKDSRLALDSHEETHILLVNQLEVKDQLAQTIADAIWDTSRNIRDCIRIGRMGKSVDDIQFLVDNFLNYNNL